MYSPIKPNNQLFFAKNQTSNSIVKIHSNIHRLNNEKKEEKKVKPHDRNPQAAARSGSQAPQLQESVHLPTPPWC